ncbi:MAG: ATP-grasp domain-containing protein [Planctomycetes bacterium]|nr:ATP-grasp domain-containing protein [Planctomycetota bacterium]
MMRIFVYEWTCASISGTGPAREALRAEGQAMLAAVLEDFNRIEGVVASTLLAPDVRSSFPSHQVHPAELGNEDSVFRRLTQEADYTLVIAPECQDLLWTRCRWVEEAGGRLLGPDAQAVQLTGDKLALSRHWQKLAIPTPDSHLTGASTPWARMSYPAVWKPRQGAGSQRTFLLRSPEDVARAAEAVRDEGAEERILQPFVPGRAASVAFLIGPEQRVPLLPAAQHLSTDGRFHYLGGEAPLPAELSARAVELAERAVRTVPGLRGYVGVDLVLGEAGDGSQDQVLEINPRLTTSYLGLRSLARANLAERMLQLAGGATIPPLSWKSGKISWHIP